MDFNYKVSDLLEVQCLKHNSRVVGGKKGLKKNVSWVHILEIRDIVRDCVNGNEMILTTGIGFITREIAVNFMMELVDCGVSALCIETALYYHKIDQELIDIADQYDFPLIEIIGVSRFLDITKELNTLIIDKDLNCYQNADTYENGLGSAGSRGSLADGLRYTAEYLGVEVAYLPITGKQYGATPELRHYIESKFVALEKALMNDEIFCSGNLAIKQLKIYEQNWGYLVFKNNQKSISQFELLILNRLSHKICGEILRDLLDREEKTHKNMQWLMKWLSGDLKEIEIKEKLKRLGFDRSYKRFLVCSINPHDMYANIIIKKAFNDKGISAIDIVEDGISYYIIMLTDAQKDISGMFDEFAGRLRAVGNKFKVHDPVTFIVGKSVCQYERLNESFKTLLEMSKYPEALNGKMIVYDKLYLKRLINRMIDDPALEEFIADHLGDLAKDENIDLLHTLKVYFECNLSKRETSEKLFIARQTLYFRLNKIIEMLGEEFCVGERRLALEFAIYAYDYLKFCRKI